MRVQKKERPRVRIDTRTRSKFTFAALGRIYGRAHLLSLERNCHYMRGEGNCQYPKQNFSYVPDCKELLPL